MRIPLLSIFAQRQISWALLFVLLPAKYGNPHHEIKNRRRASCESSHAKILMGCLLVASSLGHVAYLRFSLDMCLPITVRNQCFAAGLVLG